MAKFTRVSSIDPSAHDQCVAYVAGNRFQLDDDRPYLWKTSNCGASLPAQGACEERVPAIRRSRRVERPDDRTGSQPQGEESEHRRVGFVDVHDVESPAPQCGTQFQ